MKTAKFKSLGDIQAMAVPCAFATETSRTVEMVFRRLTSPVWANGAPIGNTNAAKNHVKQTDTPEFKAWFGKSKVVDADGKPLVVYHATEKPDFTAFGTDKRGSTTGNKASKKGFFFGKDPETLSTMYGGENENGDFPSGSRIYPVYLSLQNPKYYEVKSLSHFDKLYGDDSYSGDAIATYKGEPFAWVATHPTQIKSAIGNSGKFDPKDANITNEKPRKIIFNRARHDQTRDGAQAIYAKALKAFLQKWQLAVLNALHHQRSNVTSIPNDSVEVMVRQMFDLPGWTKIFKASMFNAAQDAYEFCAKGALSELGDNEHVTDHGITTDFALDRQNKIKDCPQGIFDGIQQSVTEGIRNGETMDELADRVKKGFDDADDDRAYLIARTEAQSAYGTAQFNVLSDAGYLQKKWQTADDERVRDSHMECEDQGAIGMDEDFSNGLSFPGDPDGEASEVIGCRCYLTTGGSAADEADRMNDEEMDNDPMFA